MNNPESLLSKYIAAVEAADEDALLALYTPNARIFDMTMPWEHSDQQSWRAMATDWFRHVRNHGSGADVTRVETHETESMVLMTFFIDYFDLNEQGEREGMSNRLSWVLVPDGEDWKILHEHTSVPLTGDTMAPVFQP